MSAVPHTHLALDNDLEKSVIPWPWTGDLHVSLSLTFLYNSYSKGVSHSFSLTIELGTAETYLKT